MSVLQNPLRATAIMAWIMLVSQLKLNAFELTGAWAARGQMQQGFRRKGRTKFTAIGSSRKFDAP